LSLLYLHILPVFVDVLMLYAAKISGLIITSVLRICSILLNFSLNRDMWFTWLMSRVAFQETYWQPDILSSRSPEIWKHIIFCYVKIFFHRFLRLILFTSFPLFDHILSERSPNSDPGESLLVIDSRRGAPPRGFVRILQSSKWRRRDWLGYT